MGIIAIHVSTAYVYSYICTYKPGKLREVSENPIVDKCKNIMTWKYTYAPVTVR